MSNALSNIATLRSGLTTGVTTVNSRTGAVTITGPDVTTALGLTPIAAVNAALTGVPTAPTATFGTNTTQLATTAMVQAAVSGSVAGVSSFNTRTGAAVLTSADVATAMGSVPTKINDTVTTGTDGASVNVSRVTSHTGGALGYVNSALRADLTVNAGVTNFEWALVGVIQNYAATGENVGVYGQGNKWATGPTWGGCFEGTDLRNMDAISSGGATLGIEVDVWCNGTDGVDSINSSTGVQTVGSRRIGVDVTIGNAQQIRNGVPGIGRGEAFAGVRVGGDTNTSTGGAYQNALAVKTALSAGIYNYAISIWGIRHSGQYQVGIDLSESVNVQSAIRLRAGENIAMEGSGNVKFKFNPSNGFLEFFNGGTRRGYIDITSGSDVSFNGGASAGSYVTTTGAQSVGGQKNFSSGLYADGGLVATGISSSGNVSLGASATVAFSGTGNVRSPSGTVSTQLRVLVDGTPYYIDLKS